MIFLLGISLFFALVVAVFASVLIIKYTRLLNENLLIIKYLQKITNVVHSVRYGNLSARIDDASLSQMHKLTDGLNSLFESISDRDSMIQEYMLRDRESNSLKSDFIATLTHDLKVPIIAQDNTFSLLLNGAFGEVSDVQKQAILNLKISNMDLKHLIEALLETYKMEQAKVELVKVADTDISKVIFEVIEQIGSVAQVHNKKINFYSGEPVFADVDIFKFKRVIQNLILNALSHSIHSECVDVHLNGADGESFTVVVQDYGCGVKKEDIEKIFEKYYSASSKFSKASTGLGLYLSNKLVQLHGGSIRVESVCEQDEAEGQTGTTFYVTLPLR